MSRRVFLLCVVAASILPTTAFSQSFLSQYKGLPYHDSRYNGGPQKIPGRVLCAYYDLGGEGVAYHDTDAKNHGSGELNPADGTYLNEFRIHEGVDTSYTKFDRKPTAIDDNPFDKVVPPRDMLYVGWTEPGEWFNITVDVAQSGTYAADFLISEWPDLPDMANADNYLREAALAHDPPSKTVYDPERDGIRCRSLGVHEHWNNGTDKKYSHNLGKAHGIELFQVS